jgi:hypothetical protein
MFKFADLDKGYGALKKRVAEIKNRKVTIGIHGKGESRIPTNAEIGSIHEFGGENMPERSFLRVTLDKNGAEYAAMARKLSKLVIDGRIDSQRALGLLGEKIKADVVAMFNANAIRPDISEATKKAKGSTTVLIDTGSLKQAIDYVVHQSGASGINES